MTRACSNRSLAALAIYTLILVAAPPASYATQAGAPLQARLHASFTPYQLGRDVALNFGFQLEAQDNQVPPPLTNIQIEYPSGLAFGLSELGLDTCSTPTLETLGPEGCPKNSLMGYGTALAEIPLGPITLHETVQVTIMRGPDQNGYFALLIYAEGQTPVDAHVIFTATILPAPPPYGGLIDISIPLVPSLPNAPNVAIARFNSTLGPQHLKYNTRTHGRIIHYQPKGIPLTTHCPKNGFHFTANITLQNKSRTQTSTTIKCP